MLQRTLKRFMARTKPSLPLLLGTATGLSLYNWYEQNRLRLACCGIVGVISTRGDASEKVAHGIEQVQNRGYDGAGIASFRPTERIGHLSKQSSKTGNDNAVIRWVTQQARQSEKHLNATTSIGHTRWRTHGDMEDRNAHPHTDEQKRVYVCHNGTIDNYQELRNQLIQQHGIKFVSETDTEIIAQLIGIELKLKQITLKQAVANVLPKLEGQWALVCVDAQDNSKIVCTRRDNPLLIGYSEQGDALHLASERDAFELYCNKLTILHDDELVELSLENVNLPGFGIFPPERVLTMTDRLINAPKEPSYPFKFWFEEEIQEQPETLRLSMRGSGQGLALQRLDGYNKNQENDRTNLNGLLQNREQIQQIRNMIVVACGSSYYASTFAGDFFKILRVFDSFNVIEGSEFTEHDLPGGDHAGLIIVSQSGETRDLHDALKVANKTRVRTLGVINKVASQISMETSCGGVFLNVGKERAVAATKSFTSQIVVLIMMAVWFSANRADQLPEQEDTFKRVRQQIIESLRRLPDTVERVLKSLDFNNQVKRVAKYVKNSQSIICLGKGASQAIAKEGALKLKELTYIHAEGFAAGELKHGPLALINPDQSSNTAVIIIILNDEHREKVLTTLSEVYSRNAQTVVISDCYNQLKEHHSKIDFHIDIENCGLLTPLLSVVAFQRLTVEICQLLKRDPDYPRNLAKCVTTR